MSPTQLSASLQALAAALALVAAPASAKDESAGLRWQATEDGQGVLDRRTRLLWSRCVEGMAWNGKTCVGRALALDLPQAQARARERSTQEGLRWRLPHLTELQRLTQTAGKHGGLDPQWFPAAPAGWHWSATVHIDSRPVNAYQYSNVERSLSEENTNRIAFLHGWAFLPDTGENRSDMPRRERLAVRLVRPMNPAQDRRLPE